MAECENCHESAVVVDGVWIHRDGYLSCERGDGKSVAEPIAVPPNDIAREFPGDPYSLPDDSEWERAEEFLRAKGIDRQLDRNNPNRMSTFAPYRGNLAYLRSQVRRACVKHGFH